MNDELTTPIGLDPPARERRFLGPLIYGFAGLVGAALLGIAGWMVIVDDPTGGHPTAIAEIDYSRQPIPVAPPKAEPKQVSGGAKILTREPSEPEPEAPEPRPQAPERPSGPPRSLSSAPDTQLVEKSKFGVLPKVSADGLRPLDRYARPARTDANAQRLPKVAVIVGGLGLSQTSTQEAIRVLPPDMTLAFAPYGNSLARWLSQARQDGHEILVQVPMEPYDYPDNDPGPHTLVTGPETATNVERLRWVLARITNYVGVVNYMGARFTAETDALSPMISEIANRGLIYIDDGSSARSRAGAIAETINAPFLRGDMRIDSVPTADDIDSRLLLLEQRARQDGQAIGMASALPISLKRLAQWAKGLEQRGLVLVPVSTLAPRS